MTNRNPANPIEGTYGPAKTPQEWREESRASIWRYEAELERLEHLEQTKPDLFASLGPAARLKLGFYLADRQAAAAAGIDTTGRPA